MTQPTPEQTLMLDNAARLLVGGVTRTRRAAKNWPEVDKTFWTQICEAAWPALLLPEQTGGWGSNAEDMVAILDGLAGILAPEPLGPSLAVASLLAQCQTHDAEASLEQFLAGAVIPLLAETASFPLNGEPRYVVSEAQWADIIICPSGTGHDFRLKAASAEDLDREWPLRRTIDGGAQRAFSLDGLVCRSLGQGHAIETAYYSARSMLRLGAAASLVGLARHALNMTVEYLKTRRQFGQPIGSFQALQHRAVSAHVTCVAAQALVYEAAKSAGTVFESSACAMAKAKSSSVATSVLKECVQMHGAIGFSDEFDLALLYRRVATLAVSYGSGIACRRDIEAA